MQKNRARTVNLTFSALMTALATILSYFPEIPLVVFGPWFAPWLKLDFSFAPLMLLGFAVGPGLMVLALLVTNVLHIFGGTSAGVGELANFLIGLAFLLPPALFYKKKRIFVSALKGMGLGIILMVIVAVLSNRFILLPFFYGSGFEEELVNKAALTVKDYLLYSIVPFNAIKGIMNYGIVFLLYKRLSLLLKKKIAQ